MEDRGTWCAIVHGITVRYDLAAEQQQQHYVNQPFNIRICFNTKAF